MAAGYCQGWRDWSEDEREDLGYSEEYFERLEAHKDKFHEDGHETAEEACECYRQFLLDVELDLSAFMPDTMKRCEVCQEFTQGLARIGDVEFVLCDSHRNRDRVEELFDDFS